MPDAEAARDVGETITTRLAYGSADFSVAEDYAYVLTAPAGAAAHRRLATSTTFPLDSVSARWYATHAAGGNQRIAIELARTLPEPVRTGTAVTRVDVSPALTGELDDALGTLGFGDAAKLHLPIGAGATPRSVQAGGPWWTWNRLGSDALPEAALNAFAGGSTVLDELGVGDGPARWAEAAATIRPDVTAQRPALLTHWGAEQWSQGSYSTRLVGWTDDHVRTLKHTHGRMVLAGQVNTPTHTAPPWTPHCVPANGRQSPSMTSDAVPELSGRGGTSRPSAGPSRCASCGRRRASEL
ncbi:MAG: hypothetical protein GEV07_21720 [Streptosporangiales bacterium]|nr:hypothetical protein [Streptosporangiales bacterium]